MDIHYATPNSCTLPRSPLSEALDTLGMSILGSFQPTEKDGVPLYNEDIQTKSVLLIGNTGPTMWSRFQAERRHEPDPMDNWTRRKLAPLAEDNNFKAVFPFEGPPFLPFQTWGERANAFFISPALPSIHPVYGTWFGLRAAFLSSDDCRHLAPPPFTKSPCETCADKLCIQACPASALSQDGYDVVRCIDYTQASPGYPCIKNGCRARHACPIGQEYAYGQAQAEFHMRGFVDVLDKIKPKTCTS